MLNFAILRLESDPAAFFDEFYPRVFRFIASASGASSADVDDLVQETLLHAWRNRGQYRGDAPLDAWLLGIARNRVRTRRRADRTRDRVQDALASIDREELPDDILRSADMIGAVRRALESLQAGQRDVLLRRYFQDMPIRMIARALGETEKAIESRLHRAREALRERLIEGGDDEL
ncbi:MAG TPA: sigma-70 family RNA polymerase sigma factor [Planctomycetota bacterium]|nr:sigma-70 family RNA polymerase sigma factor [Planctomycetota bacterium]